MMKRAKFLLILLVFVLLLCIGCSSAEVPPASSADDPITTTGTEDPDPTEAPLPDPTEPDEPEDPVEPEVPDVPVEPEKPTLPPVIKPEPGLMHSPLYIPGISTEDVLLYFNEVCLDSEYYEGGNPNLIQKWTEPIYYYINGEYTHADMVVLSGFTNWLNAIEGFPGIYQTESPDESNLQIYFCTQQELMDRLGDFLWNADGAVTFWYFNNEIYKSVICYRTDLDQYLRNSVILEEIYNGLGPVQDTSLRTDSLIYSEFSQPQWLTPVDVLILKLLYHPDILPGMNAQQCEQVIRSLYY